MAASSSSSSCRRKYDVFISFRGEDVRSSFISHLRYALSQDNIKAYEDNHDLRKGEEIWPSLCQAINDSELAIVVFSESYADSKWCLKELVEILHCRKTRGLVVTPVFYKVDPSHIRNYTATYGEAIAKHQDNESIQNWKAALTEAANISGWDSRSPQYQNESQLIKNILVDVSDKLCLRFPFKPNVQDFVQIEKHCAKVKLLLSENQYQLQQNVLVIGIWGMGGIGKTTIAKALFSQLFPQYDAVCFLANVREEFQRIGEISLCDKLLFDLLKEGHHKYNLVGSTGIMRRLRNKRVLIVLDDVDSFRQLEKLCAPCNYVGSGSKLIITTRDRHLLRRRVHDRHVYEVSTWSFAKSLELFSLHAFNQRCPKKGFEDLSKRAVNCARKVPLALKVLGSNLYSSSTEFWNDELNKLENYGNDNIQHVLQVSYDGLYGLEKKIFLDIAFFFKGKHKDDVIRILDACHFHPTSGLKVLEDKAFVTISNSGMIQMHDLIQEMGLNIVRAGSEDPRNRSRLRDIEEVSDVLKNKGSHLIEGIKLDLSAIEDLHLNADAFDSMTSLRILRLYVPSGKRSGNVNQPDVLNKLSGKLSYLEWHGCRLKSLPKSFYGKDLVEICMPHSDVAELWQGVQDVANLVRIDLSECKHLKNLPDLSKALKLKWVNLSSCESLCDIHPCVFAFDTLETLILDGCKNVKSLKSEKHLKSLKEISVNGCTGLKEFSVSSDSIRSLDLSSTGIEMLDSSIGRLTKLKSLNVQNLRHGNLPNELFSLKDLEELRICNCTLAIEKEKLRVLFDGSRSLRVLHLKNCCNLSELPHNIGGLSKLYELILDGSCVKTLPASIKHLERLTTLSLENCRMLGTLTELPPNVAKFIAVNCTSLRTISMPYVGTSLVMARKQEGIFLLQICNFLELVSLRSAVTVCFPGSKVPEQIKFRTTHSSVTVDLPNFKSDFAVLTLCVVLSPSEEMKNLGVQIWCQCYMADGAWLGRPTAWHHEAVIGLNSDHVFMWSDANLNNRILKYFDSGERRISFEFFVTNDKEERVTIRTPECGVYLVSLMDLVSRERMKPISLYSPM